MPAVHARTMVYVTTCRVDTNAFAEMGTLDSTAKLVSTCAHTAIVWLNYANVNVLLITQRVSVVAVIDACDSQPCLNGASCISHVGGYHCKCADGYTGDNCEVGELSTHRYSMIRILHYLDMHMKHMMNSH